VARQPDRPPLKLYGEGVSPDRAVVWVDSPAQADFVLGPAAPDPEPGTGDLTDREAEVLSYLADGWSTGEIADRLGIGPRTVRFHLDRLYRKLGVGRRTEAVREAVARGYLRF
jgi:DNA-binding CsgD family transcriptional regulator